MEGLDPSRTRFGYVADRGLGGVLRSAECEDLDKRLEYYRAYTGRAALEADQPLSNSPHPSQSANWHTLAEAKGVLLLDALRREMGDDAFYALMSDFFEKNTTKTVHAADFVAAAGRRASRSSRSG